MHSRKKGKAGSKKPLKPVKPSWLRYKPTEVEFIIAKLSKEGYSPSQIGMHLRDTYGIPVSKTVTGKRVTRILDEKKLLPKISEDLMALIKKSIMIKKHMETNKKDMTAKRGLLLTDSKIRRLVKYYKSSGKLPSEWQYDPEKVRLLIE